MINLRDLARPMWAVVDMDTGTVHDLNLVVVPRPAEDDLRDISKDPAEVWRLGFTKGVPLFMGQRREEGH